MEEMEIALRTVCHGQISLIDMLDSFLKYVKLLQCLIVIFDDYTLFLYLPYSLLNG